MFTFLLKLAFICTYTYYPNYTRHKEISTRGIGRSKSGLINLKHLFCRLNIVISEESPYFAHKCDGLIN